ncbi:aldo/keto reductase [Demequina muriae]|uniref:Aldo/keto reductase n=1 Tax=Demequina muriae TaxID=3051664 RepID=A0ABT8GE25_9MICO|nr:aldo/keto reductase [Demequina sp. EGI L300058]MDN4479678.1 aldo/keto reductase [Demequina sp. EGI L300058]
MKYRQLGASGAAISHYSLGTMTFGAETSEEDSHAQLDLYAERGGTVIETADVYSGGVSEQIVGRWLANRDNATTDAMFLAGKGRFPVGVPAFEAGLSRRHLRRALDATLARMGVDHLDLYQVHSWDPLTPLEETLGFLEDAVRSGKVSYVGLSNFLGWQIAQAATLARGRFPLVSMQPQYNLLAREVEWEIVPASEANGLGILPWSPLGGGWLAGKYTKDAAPSGATRLGEDPERGVEAYGKRSQDERTWRVLDAVSEVATRIGRTEAQVSLAWLDSRPAVSSIILGCRTSEQLASNLDASDVELSAEDLALLDEASDPQPANWPYGAAGVEQRSRSLG